MKRILSVILALALCLSLFACGKKPVEAPTEPATQPPTEAPTAAPAEPATEPPTEPPLPEVGSDNYLFTFTDGQENPVLTLTASLPACEALPQIDAYYKALYDDLYAACALNAEEATQRRAEFVTDGLDFTPWAVEVKCAVTCNDGKTLSVLREVYENLGGAHPLVTYRAETFDVASQGRLLLGDLFTVSEDEYLSRLKDLILPQMDKLETDSGVLYFDYAREELMTLLDPMDFALTGDSLLIFYNEYALAPYAAGLQHFYLPLSDLSDILQTQYVTE